MFNKGLSFFLQVILGFFSTIYAESLGSVLESLEDSPFGYCFVDVGITSEDLADFAAVDVREQNFFHQFGELTQLKDRMSEFLTEIGANDLFLARKVASRLTRIAQLVMEASQRETAWVHLRAFVPTVEYDVPRWHMDGLYYRSLDLKYKFVMTCQGDSTRFYRMPNETREMAFRKMRDRKFMQQFCNPQLVEIPDLGQGVFLIGGEMSKAAYHSEPPIHQNRLFFSIIPCREDQMADLKGRIVSTYPR